MRSLKNISTASSEGRSGLNYDSGLENVAHTLWDRSQRHCFSEEDSQALSWHIPPPLSWRTEQETPGIVNEGENVQVGKGVREGERNEEKRVKEGENGNKASINKKEKKWWRKWRRMEGKKKESSCISRGADPMINVIIIYTSKVPIHLIN